jgi:hypothetical protein
LNAAALRFLAPEALPADWLRLTWSPALASPGAMATLARIDPGRLILAGVDDGAALAWGARLGLRLMEGLAAEAASVPRPSVSASLPGALARVASAPLPAPAR